MAGSAQHAQPILVITRVPLAERVPIKPAALAGRMVVQWDKDALETAGPIKIDTLGLRMLSAISEAVALIAQTTGHAPDLDHLTFDDPDVYAMIARVIWRIFQVRRLHQGRFITTRLV